MEDQPTHDIQCEYNLDFEPIFKTLSILKEAEQSLVGRLRTQFPPKNPTFIFDDPGDNGKACITTITLN
jgi:hypothetical protein